MTKISVIVPIYKVERYLVQCIDSILQNTMKDIEVILLDQGEIDACRAIIEMYMAGGLKYDSRVIAVHKQNNGYGAKVNMGLDIAKGEYISIVEPDDFIDSTMFEEMYEYAKKLDADVVKAPYYEYRDAKRGKKPQKTICCYAEEMLKSTPQNILFSALDYPKIMQIHASIWSCLYKTSYLKDNNIRVVEAPGSAYVDVGFRIDTLTKTKKLCWINKPFYNYRVSNELSSSNSFDLDAMIERWSEAHQEFLKTPEIYEQIGKYLFFDEFNNTAHYIYTAYEVTNKQLEKIRENFQLVPDEIIRNAKDLSKDAKSFALSIKHKNKNIQFYKKKISWKPWYKSFITIKNNYAAIHLFKYMRHNIFRVIFRISGIYLVDFCFGKVK